jgi:transcriptional regulator with XRE-family HTH domain
MRREFVEELKELVKQSSQAEVAARSGIDPSTICRMLKGERVGRIETLMKLLDAYPSLRGFFASEDLQNCT